MSIQQARITIITTIISSLVVIIMTTVSSTIFSSSISEPINKLASTTEKLADQVQALMTQQQLNSLRLDYLERKK